MGRLVFVEGVSGVGKTTTTTQLHNRLLELGCGAKLYLEGSDSNPLDPFGGTFPPPIPLAVFTETYIKCWQKYAAGKEESLMIIDGALFHHQVNDLLREYDAPYEAIESHLQGLLRIVQHFKPVVIYLSSDSVGQRLTQAREIRKQTVPDRAKIAFWENRKRIDLRLLDALTVDKHILNVDKGWSPILDDLIMILQQ